MKISIRDEHSTAIINETGHFWIKQDDMGHYVSDVYGGECELDEFWPELTDWLRPVE